MSFRSAVSVIAYTGKFTLTISGLDKLLIRSVYLVDNNKQKIYRHDICMVIVHDRYIVKKQF